MPAPLRALITAIGERLSGSKPGVLRALVAAITVGVTAAVLTFRFLHNSSKASHHIAGIHRALANKRVREAV